MVKLADEVAVHHVQVMLRDEPSRAFQATPDPAQWRVDMASLGSGHYGGSRLAGFVDFDRFTPAGCARYVSERSGPGGAFAGAGSVAVSRVAKEGRGAAQYWCWAHFADGGDDQHDDGGA